MRIKKKHILIEYDEREMGDGYWIILRQDGNGLEIRKDVSTLSMKIANAKPIVKT